MFACARSHRRWLPALGMGLVLLAARPTHVPVDAPRETTVDDPSWSPVDERRFGERIVQGDADNARRELELLLEQRPRECAPYRLTVEAARRTGQLGRVTETWERRLQDRPDDPFLLVGYAAALNEGRELARARNLLARAVRQQTPCAVAYEELVRSSQAAGRLADVESLLIVQSGARGESGAWSLYGRGLVHEARGDNSRALRVYEQALQRERAPSEVYYRGSALLELAGELERALDWASKGADVAEARGPFALLPRLLGQQAVLHHRLGRADESEAIFHRAVELASGEPALRATLLLRRAYLFSVHGRHERAAELIEAGLQVPLHDVRADLAARAAHELGRSYLGVSDLVEARASFENSLALAEESSDVFAVWDAKLDLAQMDLIEGRPVRALEAMTPLLARSLGLEDGQRQTMALQIAATIYERLGSFERALELYQLALRGSELQRDLSVEALTLGNMAIVEMRLGLESSALVHADEAARLARRAPDQALQAGLLQSLGAALAGAGRLAEARLVYEQALATVDALVAPELNGLINAGLGRVLLALGDDAAAAACFRDALALAADVSRLVRLQALSGLALTEWRRGELREALAMFESSLEIVEASRERIATELDRVRYQETRFTIYANLAGVLTELDERYPDSGYGLRAFGVTERSRARALLDVLEPSGSSVPAMPTPDPIARAARLLEDSELVLEYALGDERSTLWAISRREVRRFALPPRAEIQREVVRFLKAVRSPPRAPSNPADAHEDAAASLYRMLIRPAASLLADVEHVIVSPHGVLHNVPFEALASRDASGALRYLVEDHALSYVPSFSVWAGLHDRRPRDGGGGLDFVGFAQSKPTLALARPVPALLPIPFADDEIVAAAGSFATDRLELFQGERATEGRLKRELTTAHRIVHIAAHALADTSRPDRSAIFVGAGTSGEDDGILEMREVSSLAIRARVVVLSGCETGLGQVMESEGTLGFTWAFLSAGASTVAVTLWNVNDRATAAMMESFYGELRKGSTIAHSLAHARRQMLRSTRRAYRHPYFWAPMIVVGLDHSMERG